MLALARGWLAAPEGKEEPAGRKQAIVLLEGFVKRNPDAVDARMTYGRLLIADNQLAPARVQFDEVIKRTPQSLDRHAKMVAQRKGRYS